MPKKSPASLAFTVMGDGIQSARIDTSLPAGALPQMVNGRFCCTTILSCRPLPSCRPPGSWMVLACTKTAPQHMINKMVKKFLITISLYNVIELRSTGSSQSCRVRLPGPVRDPILVVAGTGQDFFVP